MFGVWNNLFNFSIVVLCTKSDRRLLKNMAIFLKFVKTALIWLVLGGFFCVFSQSESTCNLHSCYKFALVLQRNCTPFSANQNWVIFSSISLYHLTAARVPHHTPVICYVLFRNTMLYFWNRLPDYFASAREAYKTLACRNLCTITFLLLWSDTGPAGQILGNTGALQTY